MALTACRECRKDVSTLASACPHCGCPVAVASSAAMGAAAPVAGGNERFIPVHTPRRRSLLFRIGRALLIVGVLFGALIIGVNALDFVYRQQQSAKYEAERSAQQAQQEQVRARIEQQARIDALDFLKLRMPERLLTDVTVKEVVVTYLGDMTPRFGAVDHYGYKADMVVSVKSDLAVLANVSTHRLKLQYHPDGTFWPDYSEIEEFSNYNFSTPLLSQ